MEAKQYYLSQKKPFFRSAIVIAIISSVLTIGIYFLYPTEFYPSYLVAFVFWTSIMLGGLFLSLLHHVSNATWSVVLRRIFESIAMTAPLMAVLFLPVVLGIHNLYSWSHTETIAAEPLLQEKAGYLNIPFFIIRSALYFLLWSAMAWILYRTSLKQDQQYQASQVKILRTVSAPGIIVFALTITFAAFDWLMSLDPHWYSTIFGLYVFAGSFLSVLAFVILTGLFLRKNNLLADVITVEHYHDLAKFLFSFTIFWGYMAFSQYFLIWYANIPEETIFFRHRWEGSWKYISLLLVFGQFLIPFLALMTRAGKRNFTF